MRFLQEQILRSFGIDPIPADGKILPRAEMSKGWFWPAIGACTAAASVGALYFYRFKAPASAPTGFLRSPEPEMQESQAAKQNPIAVSTWKTWRHNRWKYVYYYCTSV